MKRNFVRNLGFALVLATLSGAASAGEVCTTEKFLWFSVPVCTPTPDHHHGAVSAPEMDPASAMSALALALGGLAVLRARRFKNSED
jgi:hypothetical protein